MTFLFYLLEKERYFFRYLAIVGVYYNESFFQKKIIFSLQKDIFS